MKKHGASKSYMCLICDGVSAGTGVQITVSALPNASICICNSDEVTAVLPGQMLNSRGIRYGGEYKSARV